MDAYYSLDVASRLMQVAKLEFGDYRISSMPILVVAGRYETSPIYAQSYDGTATVLDYLVKQVQDNKL